MAAIAFVSFLQPANSLLGALHRTAELRNATHSFGPASPVASLHPSQTAERIRCAVRLDDKPSLPADSSRTHPRPVRATTIRSAASASTSIAARRSTCLSTCSASLVRFPRPPIASDAEMNTPSANRRPPCSGLLPPGIHPHPPPQDAPAQGPCRAPSRR